MELLLWAGIALLQLLVLPGWLWVRSLGLDRDGPIQTGLYAFGLSLVTNHLLVVALVLIGAYTRPVIVGLVVLECLLAAFLWHRRERPEQRTHLRRRVIERLAREDAQRVLWWLFAAVATTGFLISRIPQSFGSVFEYWDVIVSWNRWAVDWEAGRLPVHIFHYPQLLPTSWSLVYVVMGMPLQFVARGIMAAFPLVIVLVFLDLWWRRDRIELLVAAVAAPLLLAAALGTHLGSGLADVPVAALALLALHPIAARRFDREPRRDAARLVASGLLATGCALTKQGGLWIAVLLPLYAFVSLRGWPERARVAGVGALVAILLAGIAPWYAHAQRRLSQGFELDELAILPTLAFGDTSLFQRAVGAYDLWQSALTPPGVVAVALLVIASLAHREGRWITLSISVPYTLFWAFNFSYDLRNHALALPFVGASVAAGFEVLRGEWLRRLPGRAGRAAAAFLAGGALLWLVVWDPSAAMLDANARQLVAQGRPVLNQALLNYQAEHGFEGRILSNYRYLTSFPTLREHYFLDREAQGADFWTFRGGLDGFRRVVEDPKLGVNYVLISGFVDEDIDLYLSARTRSRNYEIVFAVTGGRLYKIHKRN